MTAQEFQRLGMLLTEQEVIEATGFARHTIRKYVECGILYQVKPKGRTLGKLRKVQVAKLLGLELGPERALWAKEPMLMREKTVRRWTGFSHESLEQIVRAGGLTRIRLPGSTAVYRKSDVGAWIGLE